MTRRTLGRESQDARSAEGCITRGIPRFSLIKDRPLRQLAKEFTKLYVKEGLAKDASFRRFSAKANERSE